MKFWKILLSIVIIVSSINISNVKADQFKITGGMGNRTGLQVIGPSGNIHFIGYASPGALVFFMENGQVIGTQLADSDSKFDKIFTNMLVGMRTIQVYALDADSAYTPGVTYSVNVADAIDTVVNIVLPPSFNIDTNRVKRSAPLIGYGRGMNNATAQIFFSGNRDTQTISTSTDADGRWSANINPKLHLGLKTAYSIIINRQGWQSEVSTGVQFTVIRTSDLNNDNLVDLTDFSILMYSYGKLPIRNAVADINDEGVVDLVDFSIMMSQWSK